VPAARCQQEADRGKSTHRLVDAVANVDDNVIEDRRG
jgi:hypothetical protein